MAFTQYNHNNKYRCMVLKRILAKNYNDQNKQITFPAADGHADSQSESSLFTGYCTNMAEDAAERVHAEVHQKPI